MALMTGMAGNGDAESWDKRPSISAGDQKTASETESHAAPINAEQLPISGSYRSVHVSVGAWLRRILTQALVANGVSQSRIADETERDAATISLMLSGRQAMAMDVPAAILANDKLGIVMTELCRRLGYEPPRRKQEDLADENRRLREQLARLRSALSEEP